MVTGRLATIRMLLVRLPPTISTSGPLSCGKRARRRCRAAVGAGADGAARAEGHVVGVAAIRGLRRAVDRGSSADDARQRDGAGRDDGDAADDVGIFRGMLKAIVWGFRCSSARWPGIGAACPCPSRRSCQR